MVHFIFYVLLSGEQVIKYFRNKTVFKNHQNSFPLHFLGYQQKSKQDARRSMSYGKKLNLL